MIMKRLVALLLFLMGSGAVLMFRSEHRALYLRNIVR